MPVFLIPVTQFWIPHTLMLVLQRSVLLMCDFDSVRQMFQSKYPDSREGLDNILIEVCQWQTTTYQMPLNHHYLFPFNSPYHKHQWKEDVNGNTTVY